MAKLGCVAIWSFPEGLPSHHLASSVASALPPQICGKCPPQLENSVALVHRATPSCGVFFLRSPRFVVCHLLLHAPHPPSVSRPATVTAHPAVWLVHGCRHFGLFHSSLCQGHFCALLLNCMLCCKMFSVPRVKIEHHCLKVA